MSLVNNIFPDVFEKSGSLAKVIVGKVQEFSISIVFIYSESKLYEVSYVNFRNS